MKKVKYCLFLIILLTSQIYSQFSTESFENWEGGVPANWFTSNLLNIYVPITQSTDARSGSYAVQGQTVPAQNGQGYPPILSAGLDAKGFPINFRPGALTGWYKFHSDSGDAFSVSLVVIKNGKAIGSGGYYSTENTSAYKQFSANIVYNSTDIPDTIQIIILITNSVIKTGCSFVLDDLSLGSATDVTEENSGELKYSLAQNYPNPFNPSTIIHFSIPSNEFVTLGVFNSIGQQVALLVNNTMTAGEYKFEFDAINLPAGIYIYNLKAGAFTQSHKMVVLK